jgi:predicted Zn-dependent peptidase
MSAGRRPQSTVLANGLTVLDASDASNPDVETVSLTLTMKTGMRHLSDHETGLLTLLGEYFVRGTQLTDTDTLLTRIDDIGAEIRMVPSTEFTRVVFTARRQHASELLELLGELVAKPSFDAQELEDVKVLTQSSIYRLEANARAWVQSHSDEVYWRAGTPDSRPSYGDVNAISNAQPGEMAALHERIFNPAQMSLTVAGGASFSEDQIGRALGGLAGTPLTRKHVDPKWSTAKPLKARVRPISSVEEPMVTVAAAIPIPALRTEAGVDVVRSSAHQILQGVLSGGMSARLFFQVRERNGLVYHISSSLGGRTGASYVQIFSWMTPPDNGPKALALVADILRQVAGDEGSPGAMSKEELAMGREQAKAAVLGEDSDAPEREGPRYGVRWASGLELITPQEASDRIDLAGDDDVRAAAREVLAGMDRMRMIVNSPERAVTQKMFDALGGDRSRGVA